MRFIPLRTRSPGVPWTRLLAVAPLAVDGDGRWQPGIGDPSVAGWVTVLAYFAAAWACFRAARRARSQTGARTRLQLAWLALAAVMAVLGVNKQLDLQSLFTEIGRDMALSQGWYAQRKAVQSLFIKAIAGGGAVVGAAVLFWLRREVRQLWLAALGAVFILVFVVVRASSFHHVDLFLHQGPAGVQMNWVLELGGIACVFAGAYRFGRRRA